MSNELYRDFIDRKADAIINSLGGTITPAPANAELYRDFLDRKFDDVVNAIGNVKVKSFSYVGTGSYTDNIIEFSIEPTIILLITGTDSSTGFEYSNTNLFTINNSGIYVVRTRGSNVAGSVTNMSKITDTKISLSGSNAGFTFNSLNDTYTVYYI